MNQEGLIPSKCQGKEGALSLDIEWTRVPIAWDSLKL